MDATRLDRRSGGKKVAQPAECWSDAIIFSTKYMHEKVGESHGVGGAQASPLLLIIAAYNSSGTRGLVKMMAKYHEESRNSANEHG